MSTHRFACLLLAISLLAATVQAQHETSHTIQQSRRFETGSHYEIMSVGQSETRSRHTDDSGKTRSSQEETIKARLDGVLTVDTVKDDGRPSQVSIIVKSFTVTTADQPKGYEAIPQGQTIVISDKRKLVDGKRPSTQVANAIDLVYQITGEDLTLDELFPPGGPKSPGDRWAADTERLAAALSTAKLAVRQDALSGYAQFDGVKEMGIGPTMQISQYMTVNNTPMAGLPRGFDQRSGRLQIKTVWVLPLDTTKPEYQFTLSQVADFQLRFKAKSLNVRMQLKSDTRYQLTPTDSVPVILD